MYHDSQSAVNQCRLQRLTSAHVLQLVNEKPQVIQEYEAGKAIPNPQILGKLSRALGVPFSKKGPKPEPVKAAPKRK